LNGKFAILLLVSFLVLYLVGPVFSDLSERDFLPIYIHADGAVDPSDSPLKNVDNHTYELEADVFGNVVVERSDVVIEGKGFWLCGVGEREGVKFFKVSNVTVRNLNIQSFEVGVFLYSSFCLDFYECFVDKSLFGFKGDSSANVNVVGCRVLNNGFGFVFQNCSGINICESFIQNSSYHGLFFSFSSLNSICNNSITGNYRGIYFDFSSNNTIIENNITENFYKGVRLAYSNYNVIYGNNVSSNSYGFWFYNSSFNSFFRNCLLFNARDGVLFEMGSNSNLISENMVAFNDDSGVYLNSSFNNVFLHNSFVENGANVIVKCEDCSNFWDDGVEGNYWSNYFRGDSDHDGIGDEVYVINRENVDCKPLMGMFKSFDVSGGEHINVISNSTVDNVVFFDSNGTLRFSVYGNIMFGFCRIAVPFALVNSSVVSVLIDDGEAEVLYPNYKVYSNSTHFWVYFAFKGNSHEVQILDELHQEILLVFLILSIISVFLSGVLTRKKEGLLGFLAV